ncbi:MAG: LPS export ABC transporter permease LptG [Marinibacterium sp.]|nr:LPS export ABC transporter permease LptG [Marinibacterium sp.]
MILDTYFARRYLMSFALIATIFLSLLFLIDLIEQVRAFQSVDVGLGDLIGLVLLNLPAALDQILPLMAILATVLLFVTLARSSELVVTRAVGRSGLRVLLGPVMVTLIIGVLAVAMLNPLVVATSERYKSMADTFRSGNASAASLSGEGLWLRQGDATGQSVIHATGYDVPNQTLYGVFVLNYDPDLTPISQIRADSAQLIQDAWILTNAKVWPLEPGQTPERNAVEHARLELPSTLTAERIEEGLGRASGVSVWELPKTIRELDSAGFSTRRLAVELQAELASPVFLIAMVLVGAAFTMRHARSGGTGLAVLLAVLLGFGLFFVRNFALVLGNNGHLPVALAAWAPPVASCFLAIGLLLQVEDG